MTILNKQYPSKIQDKFEYLWLNIIFWVGMFRVFDGNFYNYKKAEPV